MNLLRLFRHPKNLVDMTPADLHRRLSPDLVLIDVRTPREYRSGHIRGAISAPLGHEAVAAKRSPTDAAVVLVCKTGHRSQAAAATLLDLGYTNVAHLKGGMDAWSRAGLPTERR